MLIERWRRHYNPLRAHSALGYKPPAPDTWSPGRSDPASATWRLRPYQTEDVLCIYKRQKRQLARPRAVSVYLESARAHSPFRPPIAYDFAGGRGGKRAGSDKTENALVVSHGSTVTVPVISVVWTPQK